MRRRKQGDYPREAKLAVVERLKRGESAQAMARALKEIIRGANPARFPQRFGCWLRLRQ
jgi:hypothetical protein